MRAYEHTNDIEPMKEKAAKAFAVIPFRPQDVCLRNLGHSEREK